MKKIIIGMIVCGMLFITGCNASKVLLRPPQPDTLKTSDTGLTKQSSKPQQTEVTSSTEASKKTSTVNNKQSSQPKPTSTESDNRRTDSGQYIGRIDNNSIEIRISGVQDEEQAYMAFRLTENLQSRFDKGEFKENDQVKFVYDFVKSTGQNILVSIEKIVN